MKATEILRATCNPKLRAKVDEYCRENGVQLADVIRAGVADQITWPLPDPLPALAQVPRRGRPANPPAE